MLSSALALLGAATLTACGGGTSGPRPATHWRAPAHYTFTMTTSSMATSGRFRIAVGDGRIRKVTALDAQARRSLHRESGRDAPPWLPTLGELQRKVEKAYDDGAAKAEARHDASDGHPTHVEIDPDGDAVDDETSYDIPSYEQGTNKKGT